MLKQENNKIAAMYINGYNVLSIYMRGRLVWAPEVPGDDGETILSCYFDGYWIDEYPWTDDTPWKN